MKRYIRASKDSDKLLDSFNLVSEIRSLAETFKEFGEDDIDSKIDFVAQHIYDMLHDITFEEVYDFVESKIKK